MIRFASAQGKFVQVAAVVRARGFVIRLGIASVLAACGPPSQPRDVGIDVDSSTVDGDVDGGTVDAVGLDGAWADGANDVLSLNDGTLDRTLPSTDGGDARSPGDVAADMTTVDATCTGDAHPGGCDGDTGYYQCFGTVLMRIACTADRICSMATAEPQCVLRSPGCDPRTFVESCDADGRALICDAGVVRTVDVCGAGHLCVGVDPVSHGYQCADASRTRCDPTTFAARCEGSVAVDCPPWGFVSTGTCHEPNPLCVTRGARASCSFVGARSCSASTPCTASAPTWLFVCNAVIDREVRLGCVLRDMVQCTCREQHVEGGVTIFNPECRDATNANPCGTFGP